MSTFAKETKDYLYSCIQKISGSYLDGPFGDVMQDYHASNWEQFISRVQHISDTNMLGPLIIAFAFQYEHTFFKRYNTTTCHNGDRTQCYHYYECAACKSAKISALIMHSPYPLQLAL
jgi:hypothetical protein